MSPEAAVGGPLALVQDGDEITIDADARTLELNVDEDELARRRERLGVPELPRSRGLPVDLPAQRAADVDGRGAGRERLSSGHAVGADEDGHVGAVGDRSLVDVHRQDAIGADVQAARDTERVRRGGRARSRRWSGPAIWFVVSLVTTFGSG